MNNGISIIKIVDGISKTISIANKLLPIYTKLKPYLNKGISLPIYKKNVNSNSKNEHNNNHGPTFFQ